MMLLQSILEVCTKIGYYYRCCNKTKETPEAVHVVTVDIIIIIVFVSSIIHCLKVAVTRIEFEGMFIYATCL